MHLGRLRENIGGGEEFDKVLNGLSSEVRVARSLGRVSGLVNPVVRFMLGLGTRGEAYSSIMYRTVPVESSTGRVTT